MVFRGSRVQIPPSRLLTAGVLFGVPFLPYALETASFFVVSLLSKKLTASR